MKGFIFVIGMAIVGSVMGAGTAKFSSTTKTPDEISTVEMSEETAPTSRPPFVDH
jgi:hypothetical protein